MRFRFDKILFILSTLFFLTTINLAQTEREKGIELYRQGEYQQAVEVLQKIVKTEEDNRPAWLYLGASYVKLKKDVAAVQAFHRTNVIYKKNLTVYDKQLKIVSRPQANYTRSAEKNLTSGTVKIAVEFGADGKIGFVFPFQSLPDGLTENVLAAAKTIKFEPAIKDKKPVTVVTVLEYNFSL